MVDVSAPPSRGAQEGDEVSCLLLSLGGYGEYALASSWTPKPPNVSWSDAAALPSSSRDQDVVRGLGGVPVTYGPGLADRVRDSARTWTRCLMQPAKASCKMPSTWRVGRRG